jgi:hypothetical protein
MHSIKRHNEDKISKRGRENAPNPEGNSVPEKKSFNLFFKFSHKTISLLGRERIIGFTPLVEHDGTASEQASHNCGKYSQRGIGHDTSHWEHFEGKPNASRIADEAHKLVGIKMPLSVGNEGPKLLKRPCKNGQDLLNYHIHTKTSK